MRESCEYGCPGRELVCVVRNKESAWTKEGSYARNWVVNIDIQTRTVLTILAATREESKRV